MADRKIKRALISVHDKTGIVDFARALCEEFGIEIISTGGTAALLKKNGIPVTLVEEVTGFPEMMDGRVKTLHPKIHAGILADRDNPEHMRQLAEQGIKPIDMVVVNLYPFEKTVADPNCTFEEAIEMIDIGGPCLLRAAAKNHRHVIPLCERETCGLDQFDRVLSLLRGDKSQTWDEVSLALAGQVFRSTYSYDLTIRDYLALRMIESQDSDFDAPSHLVRFPQQIWQVLEKRSPSRYGENPHQRGAIYKLDGLEQRPKPIGKESKAGTSFNNYADADAARGLCHELHTSLSPSVRVRGRATTGSHESHHTGEEPPSREMAAREIWQRIMAGDPLARQAAASMPRFWEDKTGRDPADIDHPQATYFVTLRAHKGMTPEERDILMGCCIYPDKEQVCLHGVVVMPGHVHLLLTQLDAIRSDRHSLSKIIHRIKAVSESKIADHRKQRGPVWHENSSERIVADGEEFWLMMSFIHGNPTTAAGDLHRPHAWCVFDPDAAWDSEHGCAFVDTAHGLHAGQVIEGYVAPERDWHHLLGQRQHRLVAGATQDPVPGATAVAVFVKHTNACGVGIATVESESNDAIRTVRVEAYRRAYLGDPNAAMGGILACNFPIDAEFADAVMNTYARWGKAAGAGGFFVEVWVAPGFDDEAIEVIRGKAEGGPKKKWGERVRLLAVNMNEPRDPDVLEHKQIVGGMLVQERDLLGLNENQWKIPTKRKPTDSEMSDLRLAWLVCKHTKSNAISVCKDGMLIGNGAGQMSRVMSCRIATWLAKENGHEEKLRGSVAASDAFFPFSDGPGLLIDAGVSAIIQPGGSKRDADTIAVCDERDVAMIFTGTRHFKH